MSNITLSSLFQIVNQQSAKSITTTTDFDFIVIGLGSMGSATVYNLAKQGYKVLGLEQFDITHENGSHAGQSRLIRMAYFEHPDYVPLLKRAYANWKSIEEKSETKLYYPTGILYAGLDDDFLIRGSKESAKEHNLPLEGLTQQQQAHRYPQFNIPEKYTTIFEHNAGFLTPERAILTYVDQALNEGAEIHSNEKLLNLKSEGDSVEVKTEKATYRCNRLITTAGPWTKEILPSFKKELKVTRQLLAWMETKSPENYELNRFPCWGINQEGYPGLFYGFPILPNDYFGGLNGLKLGYHYPGEEIDPDDTESTPSQDDIDILLEFMEKFLPGSFSSINQFKACKYTYSPDEHFIIDFHPDHKNVLIAAGFSGHGFKFASVIGEILTDLATTGKTDMSLGFLSADRF